MNRKLIATLVGTALIAGCNSSDSDKEANLGTISFASGAHSEDYRSYELCFAPNLEVLIHDLQGTFIDMVTTDDKGELSLADIPNNHYFTVNPDQEGFEPTNLSIDSIQKELVGDGNQIYFSGYNGPVIDCATVEVYQTYDVETDIENLVTFPEYDSWDGTIDVNNDQPGIFAFSCGDEGCEEQVIGYTYIERSEYEGLDKIDINENMLKPLNNSLELTVKPLMSATGINMIVNGETLFTDFYVRNGVTSEAKEIALPEEVEGLDLSMTSLEHLPTNGFTYFITGQYSVNHDITLEGIPANSFILGGFDGTTFDFELNDFSADAVFIEKYLHDSETDISHSVYAKSVVNSVTIPDILPEMGVELQAAIMLMEMDSASRVSIDNLTDTSRRVIMPFLQGSDL
ncbi:hypothetical protein [Vibrio sp. WXL210]|uniref:hypothetical protein n=1 Tax=Vibrio sp. WXL210 TaxID=3450709 RepID=UPI003EC6A802